MTDQTAKSQLTLSIWFTDDDTGLDHISMDNSETTALYKKNCDGNFLFQHLFTLPTDVVCVWLAMTSPQMWIISIMDYFENQHFLSKNCHGNFWASFGRINCFLLQHLVTLSQHLDVWMNTLPLDYNNHHIFEYFVCDLKCLALVLTELAEWLLLQPEHLDSNPLIGNFHGTLIYFKLLKRL